ncbi:MAG: hypothetical protein ABH851_03725 [Methanobacteriota archaeon]
MIAIKPSKKQGFGYVLIITIILLLLYFNRQVIESPTNLSIGLLALILVYFSGILAFFVGILFSVYTGLVSLPVISAIYAFIAYSLARIHYMIATFVVKKFLKRTKWYRETKIKIKNSWWYKLFQKNFNRITRRLGLAEPHMYRVYEVVDCKSCERKIPKESKYCPICGKTQT